MKTLIVNFLYSQFEVWWNAQESITNALHEDTVFTLDDINKLLSAHDTKEVGEVLANLWYERYSATMDAYTEIDKVVTEYRNRKESQSHQTETAINQLQIDTQKSTEQISHPVNYRSKESLETWNNEYTNRWAYHPTTGEYIDNMTYTQYEEIMWFPFDDKQWEEPRVPNNYSENFNQSASTMETELKNIETEELLSEILWKQSPMSSNEQRKESQWIPWEYDVNSWWSWWGKDKQIDVKNWNIDTPINLSDSEFQEILNKYGKKLVDNDFIKSIDDPKVHEAILRNYEIATDTDRQKISKYATGFLNIHYRDLLSLVQNPNLNTSTLKKCLKYIWGRNLLGLNLNWISRANAALILAKVTADWPYTIHAHHTPWFQQGSNFLARGQAEDLNKTYRELQRFVHER